MADTIKIQVITEESTPYGTFRDAIYYSSLAEYEAKKLDGSHDAEKSKRVDNYISMIQNPPVPVKPTKAELESLKLEILSQAEAQIADIDAKIAEKGK